MGLFTKDIKTMNDLFVHQLQDIYYAEQQLVKALPKMADKAVDCPAIDGIIEEADEVSGEVADEPVLDAALINAAQAAEHYEIARYGSLISWARQLGRSDASALLQKTLDEEKLADRKLTTLAEGRVNLRAAS
jgi:ferritin-like metal-binding protein YciE